MCLQVDTILSTAEGIYHQIISTPHLSDQIRIILGIPTVQTRPDLDQDRDLAETRPVPGQSQAETSKSQTQIQVNGNTMTDSMEEVMYQIGLDMNF